jgi:Tfp pilus assembly protein PilV
MIDTFLSRLPNPRSESGFMLIEVMISAMLVGLIALATFNGLTATQKATADERSHAQATVIAQQDEERLRGMTSTQLSQLGTVTNTVAENGVCVEQVSGTWRYYSSSTATAFCEKSASSSGTYTGTVFTVSSSAQFVAAGEEKLTCEVEKGSTDYIQTTSAVTWAALTLNTKRPAVSQSSQVAVPSSASLMATVKNRNNEPVSGVTVKVFDPSTATTPTVEETTPESGCVIFGALAEGNVKVVALKPPWIDHASHQEPEQTVSVSTASLAEAKFTLEDPGSITAEFLSNGAHVNSFTFFAYQTETPSGFVGGSASTTSSSATITELFPFVTPGKPPTPNKYAVYAGDCSKNDPVEVTKGIEVKEDPTAQVEPGMITTAQVEAPAVNAQVYEGTSSVHGAFLTANLQTAMLINTECSSAAPSSYQHKVTLNSEGKVEQKYQPYAKKLEFCVVALISSKYYKYKSPTSFENKAKAGTTIGPFYIKEPSGSGYSNSSSKLTCP